MTNEADLASLLAENLDLREEVDSLRDALRAVIDERDRLRQLLKERGEGEV